MLQMPDWRELPLLSPRVSSSHEMLEKAIDRSDLEE